MIYPRINFLAIFLLAICQPATGQDVSMNSRPNEAGEQEYFIDGEKVDRKTYLHKQLQVGENLITLTDQDRVILNSIRNYNRTKNPKSLEIIKSELKNPHGIYHKDISRLLALDHATLPAYLAYARQEDEYSGKVLIAIALRNAPYSEEVIQFLETLRDDPDNYGLIANSAKRSLMDLANQNSSIVENEQNAKSDSEVSTTIQYPTQVSHPERVIVDSSHDPDELDASKGMRKLLILLLGGIVLIVAMIVTVILIRKF